jgi:photosystem II stability/assembly factor-like uncharacterized protein
LLVDPLAPATLYAGGNSGVFKSLDAGADWVPAGTGLAPNVTIALAINPINSNVLYAGTSFAGVFKTINGGGSWITKTAGLTNTYVTALAINPLTPATVYAGTSAGVFRSTNGGNHWSPIGNGLSGGYVQVLLVHPLTPTIVYAAINPLNGVFRSTDGGSTWSPANSGLPDVVFSLLVDPARPNVVYAGTGGRVYRSTDTGQSWSQTNFGSAPSESIQSVAVVPGILPTIFGGTYSAGVLVGEPGRLALPLVLR